MIYLNRGQLALNVHKTVLKAALELVEMLGSHERHSKPSMSELKLRRMTELNVRLKEDLERPRIPVSKACQSLITFTTSTKDAMLPSIWGQMDRRNDPFSPKKTFACFFAMDGDVYIRRLAQYIRANEASLACAMESSVRRNKYDEKGLSVLKGLYYHWMNDGMSVYRSSTLCLTPHYLFYVLSRFNEMELSTGPMNVRLETLRNVGDSGHYVSFLEDYENGAKKVDMSDARSIRSVSSIRSVVKGISSLWGRLSTGWKFLPEEKVYELVRSDIVYLYSSFTKLPSLKLMPSSSFPMIDGYEEFPFDTAIPLSVFKNLKSLEIQDVEIKRFYGWDKIADNLCFLTVKGCGIRDANELIIDIVLNNIEKRRKMRIRKSNSLPLTSRSKLIEFYQPLSTSQEYESSGAIPLLGSKKMPSSHTRKFSSPLHNNFQVQHDSEKPNVSSNELSGSPDFSTSIQSHSVILSLRKWRFLKYLSLSNNSLSMLSFFAMIPISQSLISLNISYNMFVEIPYSLTVLSCLKSLNISHNRIESLHSLMQHPLLTITTIDIRSNRLRSLAGIEKLTSLERLDVRDNLLSDPMEIARLVNALNFRYIWVAGNPFTQKHFSTYRITIFNLFRTMSNHVSDILIDGRGPGIMEKRRLFERVRRRKQSSTDSEKMSLCSFDADCKVVTPEQSIVQISTIDRKSQIGKARIVDFEFSEYVYVLVGKIMLNNDSSKLDDLSLQDISANMISQKGEEYRRRIETLKNDVGENWLKALNEEMWVKQQ
ncbi:hypothetical protein PORY_000960 [Pneumocystis oryctolagi]|uniref:Uncharacterized protein n=1 Tax=Pneumocystis oryctolagi TaxID=42067 RepID=A0ACB7CIC6_9ASCO|nr:hypothetical protein PORY_000960 [Pneumocystis oryctolagi]